MGVEKTTLSQDQITQIPLSGTPISDTQIVIRYFNKILKIWDLSTKVCSNLREEGAYGQCDLSHHF